jgi:hypothetical protein
MHINPKLIGVTKFTVTDPNMEYTYQGYCQNDTFLLIGSHFDSVNNRTVLKTFKMTEVKFLGDISVHI